jgi:hypothetical protein
MSKCQIGLLTQVTPSVDLNEILQYVENCPIVRRCKVRQCQNGDYSQGELESSQGATTLEICYTGSEK